MPMLSFVLMLMLKFTFVFITASLILDQVRLESICSCNFVVGAQRASWSRRVQPRAKRHRAARVHVVGRCSHLAD